MVPNWNFETTRFLVGSSFTESKVFVWLGAAFWKQFRYFHPYLYRVFIDAINGNLVNSLLGITIEIQMKEDEYVVIVRFPNRFWPIFMPDNRINSTKTDIL